MKYKAKISIQGTTLIPDLIKDSTHTDENYEGVIVFIPFTDTNFFEPVKTRKFEIEVSEEHIDRFYSLINDGFEPWTVTDVTMLSWIKDYKSSGSYYTQLFSVEELSTIDVNEFKDDYQCGNRLQGVKWLKDQFGKGLKESKELADYIFALQC